MRLSDPHGALVLGAADADGAVVVGVGDSRVQEGERPAQPKLETQRKAKAVSIESECPPSAGRGTKRERGPSIDTHPGCGRHDRIAGAM